MYKETQESFYEHPKIFRIFLPACLLTLISTYLYSRGNVPAEVSELKNQAQLAENVFLISSVAFSFFNSLIFLGLLWATRKFISKYSYVDPSRAVQFSLWIVATPYILKRIYQVICYLAEVYNPSFAIIALGSLAVASVFVFLWRKLLLYNKINPIFIIFLFIFISIII